MDYQYTLDDSGHRTRIEEHNGRITDYIYDDLYRLTNEDITDITNGNYSATYDYDNVGNRTSSTINGVSTVYSYDDNDRLTQQSGETYGYDDNGNTTTKTIDNETSSYRYDVKNQLNRATLNEGGITTNTSYRYDVDGIRIQKTENSNTIDYLVDHNRDYAQVLKETDQSTSQSLDYLYGDDLINQSQDNSNERYYLYDGLGSTRALTDATGLTTDSYDYEAFGSTLNQTGSTENNYLFTGEQYDHSLDQQYLRARYYNPSIGRFTQQDTWMGNNSNPQTLNKYVYTHADPINNIDPTGYFTLGNVSAANTIRGELTSLQLDIGLGLFDSIVSGEEPDDYISSTTVGVFALGVGGGKLAQILSKKARKLCPTNAHNCFRAKFGKIKTPYGIAKQSDNHQAWNALKEAKNGALLFRVGKLGRSHVSEAQFWSLKDPRKLSPREFANEYGIPKENADFNFLVIGKLNPGKPAITRIAPGTGSNSGGGIELVTNPNSVSIHSFSNM